MSVVMATSRTDNETMYKQAILNKRNHEFRSSFSKLRTVFNSASSLNIDDVLLRCRCVIKMTKILKLCPHLMTKSEFMEIYVTPIVALLVYYSLYTHAVEIARRTGLSIYDKELYVHLSGSLIATD